MEDEEEEEEEEEGIWSAPNEETQGFIPPVPTPMKSKPATESGVDATDAPSDKLISPSTYIEAKTNIV